MKAQFFHKRKVIDNPKKLSYNDLHPLGGETICVIFNDKTKIWQLGVAKCSMKDRFTKKIGRDISLGRAIKIPFKFFNSVEHVKDWINEWFKKTL